MTERTPAASSNAYVERYKRIQGISWLIGLGEDKFLEQAKAKGWTCRIVMRDGESYYGTADVNDNRLNYAIIDGKVVHVTIG